MDSWGEIMYENCMDNNHTHEYCQKQLANYSIESLEPSVAVYRSFWGIFNTTLVVLFLRKYIR